MDIIKDLYTLWDTLSAALKDANEKIRNAGGKLNSSDMDYVDKLTHAIKSVKASIAMLEAGEDGGGSYRDGYSRDGYSRDGGSYDGSYYDGRSYARGRGRNAKRDSMGRYSSMGYSGQGDMIDELRDLMDRAPDDQTRQEMHRLIQKMEQR